MSDTATPDGDYRLLPIQDALSRLARAANRDGDPAALQAFVSVHHAIRELRVRVTELEDQRGATLKRLERRYVEALNAVLAASPSREADHDGDRWRGHAETCRQTCEQIRRDAGLPAVSYLSSEWRDEHGVYTEADMARFRGEQP